MPTESSRSEFATEVIAVLGGREAARRIIDAEHDDLLSLWFRPDVDLVGRVLRAHLFLEHHVGHALQAANPRLGRLREARLTFNTKVMLLDRSEPMIDDLVPAILHVGKVRNRIAHNLKATLSVQDAQIVQRPKLYSALRQALGKPDTADPVVAIEELAMHAGSVLRSETSRLSRAITVALATIKERHESEAAGGH